MTATQVSASDQPWYSHITLDLLVRVLSRSIFHPAIILIFYLCLASVHKHREPIAVYTLYYASILLAVDLLRWLNPRIATGWPRKVVWENEVVIITGGGSGLGRALVEMLVRKGARVGVLDLQMSDQEMQEVGESGPGDLCWQICDVGNLDQVQQAIRTTHEEFGTISILINNAASPIHALPLLPSTNALKTLTPQQAAATLSTNAISHFNLLHATLPYLTTSTSHAGAHIITISSILSHLGPSHLSDYAASKAAISAIHTSLTAEIATHQDKNVRQRLKTLLVEIGQMDTNLFGPHTTLPWYANFFGPILGAKDVAMEIVRVVERGEGGVIRLPFYAKIIGNMWGVVPGSVQKGVRWWSGVDEAVGQGKGKQAGKGD